MPFVERSPDRRPVRLQVGGYYRDRDRVAPYNLYASAPELIQEAKGASTARDIGFRFGALPAGGKAAAS